MWQQIPQCLMHYSSFLQSFLFPSLFQSCSSNLVANLGTESQTSAYQPRVLFFNGLLIYKQRWNTAISEQIFTTYPEIAYNLTAIQLIFSLYLKWIICSKMTDRNTALFLKPILLHHFWTSFRAITDFHGV